MENKDVNVEHSFFSRGSNQMHEIVMTKEKGVQWVVINDCICRDAVIRSQSTTLFLMEVNRVK